MPTTCIVIMCGSRCTKDKVSFYSVPAILNMKHKPNLNELSRERRRKWIAAIRRSDLTEQTAKNQRVCSRHFLTGN